MAPRSTLLAVAALLALGPLFSAAEGGPALAGKWFTLGKETFEPTLGADADGRIFLSMTPVNGVAIGFGTGVWRSNDYGESWSDVSPRIAGVRLPPETNDPYVYVDDSTGRVYQFAMAPILVCSIMSWSDNQGASWTTNPKGCFGGLPWDHQTMVASTPRTVTTVGYPNVLTMCTNNGVGVVCGRSLDGGLVWGPAGHAPSMAICGGLTGHLKAAPDGTLYLPRIACNTAMVFVSKNDGTTWTGYSIGHDANGGPDSTVAVDGDGNAYYAYIDTDGTLLLSVRPNGFPTWSAPVVASAPGVTANLPAIAVGAPGKIVIAYAGTTGLANGYASTATNVTTWDAYLTVSLNALDAAPAFESVIANPAGDPIVRGACGPGRCPGLIDFLDVIVAPNGRPYAAFVDACKGTCVTETKPNNASEATVATLSSGPLLR